MKNLRTLVLNSSYMPLSLFPLYTIPAEEAIHRFVKGNCTIVSTYEYPIKTPSRDDLYWPSVIANHNGHSFKKEVRLRKESLFYRDHCICQYCGSPLTPQTLTYDHYPVPRSKGGRLTFDNTVASCKKCNNKKGDSVSDKWKPKHQPWTPTFWELLEIRKKYPIVVDHESWIQFLPAWASDVYIKGQVPKDVQLPPTFVEDEEVREFG